MSIRCSDVEGCEAANDFVVNICAGSQQFFNRSDDTVLASYMQCSSVEEIRHIFTCLERCGEDVCRCLEERIRSSFWSCIEIAMDPGPSQRVLRLCIVLMAGPYGKFLGEKQRALILERRAQLLGCGSNVLQRPRVFGPLIKKGCMFPESKYFSSVQCSCCVSARKWALVSSPLPLSSSKIWDHSSRISREWNERLVSGLEESVATKYHRPMAKVSWLPR